MSVRSSETRERLLRLVPLIVAEGTRLTEVFAQQEQLHTTDMEALGVFGIADAQQRVMTAGTLGAELRLSSGAVTFLLDRLTKVGLVERVRDERDKRKLVLRLSQGGRELIQHLVTPILSESHCVMDQFSPEELATVARFLEATAAAISSHRESMSTQKNAVG